MKAVIHTVKVLEFDELNETAQLEAMRDQMISICHAGSLRSFDEILSEEGKRKLREMCQYQGDTEETQRKFFPDGKLFQYNERGNYLITKI